LGQITVFVKKLNSKAKVPAYAHKGPLGDLAADIFSVEDVEIPPGKVRPIATGIALELPPDYGAIIEDRSGMAINGVSTVGGIIDTGYRGEIRVVLTNIRSESYQIKVGDRIAQLRLVQRLEANFVEVNQIGSSERNEKGFGSTGN
jgi:dUTP pyrophosphatase